MLKHSQNLSLSTQKSAFFKIIGLSLLLILISAIAIALPSFTDLVVGSDTSTIRNPGAPVGDLTSYGKPNQSRIWYNSGQNRWDGVVPRLDADNTSDHYILTDVPGSQTFTSIELARRDFSRPDAFWDDANQLLYVLASHPVESRFWRVGYDNNSDSYNIEVGVPGTGVAVPGIAHPNNFRGGDSPATLYVTPNGNVWVAVMANNGLQVQHSSDGGANWMATPVTLDSTAMLGVTSWIDFEFGGTTFVGVFASENGEMGNDTEFFFWYIDQNDDPTVLGNWIDDSANIPAPMGIERSDDHDRAARDAAGNQYFVVKTEDGNPTDPLIKLFKRTPGGTWSQFNVTETQDVPEQSRPSIVIDDANSELYLYVTGAEIVDPNVREGLRVKARLDSLEDLATAPFVTLFSEPGIVFTDIISPRAAVNSTSDIVVLVHNRTDETVWYSEEEIQPAPVSVPVPTVVGLPQADAEQAIFDAGLTVGNITSENSDTVPVGDVISQNPGNPESVRDNFNTSSFTNNNGTFNWTGGWIEVDGDGAGPTSGNVRITNGELSLDDRPNTGGEPSLAREADLSGFTAATFSFRYRTTSGVDPSDSVVVEISDDGGANWTVLENFTGISGSSAGTRIFDVSSFISNDTRIRFRVNNLYGGSSEKFRVDNVEIEVTGNLVPVGTPIDLVVSLGSVGGDDDDDDDSDDGDDDGDDGDDESD